MSLRALIVNTRQWVRKNGAGSEFQRRRLNFIEGANVTLTVADDPTDDEVDITIAAGAAGAPADATYVTTTANGTLTNEVLLSAVVGRGTVAARPAAGTAGRLYIVTDAGDERLTRDNGTTWDDLSYDWDYVSAKPSTFAPSAHTHPQSEVTNLVSDLAAKADLSSPTFTGDPKAPTPAADDNDTSIATTAYVQGEIANNMDGNARVGVRKNSAGSTFTRRRLNLIEGSGVTLTVGDDSGDEEVDVTIAAAGAAVEDIQTFTSSGTWTKPAGAKVVEVFCVGGAGGGGSGRRGASLSARTGGAGGSGGAVAAGRFIAADLGSTVAVTIGAAGAGGAAVTTDDTDGTAGTDGGHTTFGSHLSAGAGLGGAGGSTVNVSGASGRSSTSAGGMAVAAAGVTPNGGAGNTTAGSTGGNIQNMYVSATGGGGGGGLDTSDTQRAGGAGGNLTTALGTNQRAGGTAGTSGGGAGGAGNAGLDSLMGGTGGGGGGSGTAGGGAGGAGGNYGGGGGGGGASQNGANSGAGGNGVAGRIIVITRF